MAKWLHQLTEKSWSLNNYCLDIWEGERWEWEVGRVTRAVTEPKPGGTVAFFYALAKCIEPGSYGWAVILLWTTEEKQRFYFRPVPPSDQLKMRPWWDDQAKQIADQVSGKVARGTLWPVPDDLTKVIRAGISSWVNGGAA